MSEIVKLNATEEKVDKEIIEFVKLVTDFPDKVRADINTLGSEPIENTEPLVRNGLTKPKINVDYLNTNPLNLEITDDYVLVLDKSVFLKKLDDMINKILRVCEKLYAEFIKNKTALTNLKETQGDIIVTDQHGKDPDYYKLSENQNTKNGNLDYVVKHWAEYTQTYQDFAQEMKGKKEKIYGIVFNTKNFKMREIIFPEQTANSIAVEMPVVVGNSADAVENSANAVKEHVSNSIKEKELKERKAVTNAAHVKALKDNKENNNEETLGRLQNASKAATEAYTAFETFSKEKHKGGRRTRRRYKRTYKKRRPKQSKRRCSKKTKKT